MMKKSQIKIGKVYVVELGNSLFTARIVAPAIYPNCWRAVQLTSGETLNLHPTDISRLARRDEIPTPAEAAR